MAGVTMLLGLHIEYITCWCRRECWTRSSGSVQDKATHTNLRIRHSRQAAAFSILGADLGLVAHRLS
eukprot:3640057-Pleurochrysis_carterae.AAC.1